MPNKESKIGQRRTHQREFIVETINKAEGPLTVNEIQQAAQKDGHHIGIATIYRTIKLLLEKEVILLITLPDGQARYETAQREHHHHFQCKVCNKVIDVDKCCMHLHEKEVEGHLVDRHEITLIGTCKDCR